MLLLRTAVVFAVMAIFAQARHMDETLYASDLARLRGVLESQSRLSDLCSIYYSVLGLQSLEVEVVDKTKLCDALKTLPAQDAENMFCAVSASKKLNCPVTLNTDQITALKNGLKDKASVEKLYYSYAALQVLGKAGDVKSTEVVTVLKEALKTDDSPASYGYAFHLAALLPPTEATLFVEYIEDIVAQADEVDGKYLQYEGGLFTTALVVESALTLADRAGKVPPGLDGKKVVHFANYLLSRRLTTQVKAAGRLAAAMAAMGKSNYYRPISVSISPDAVTLSDTKRMFKVDVRDILGRLPKSTVTVMVVSAKHVKTGKSLADNKQMKMNEVGFFELEITEPKPESGLYKFTLKVTSSDTKIVGITEPIVLETRVVTQVTVAPSELGVVDADASAAGVKLNPVNFPNKMSQVLDADHHQKVLMKFQVKDVRLDKAITVHQAFVRLENVNTGREVVFVAEPESATSLYKFDLPVNTKAKDFQHQSGEYRMYLIIGDTAIAQSQIWHVANIRLHFVEQPAPAKKIDDVSYEPKPEIKHLFRAPEKRPPEVVSIVFTALCLAPILILLGLWGKLGANLYGMEMNLSTLGFHVGLACIFGLFGCFFIWLDMFTTLKLLVLISLPTFYFGNRVLSSLAGAKKA